MSGPREGASQQRTQRSESGDTRNRPAERCIRILCVDDHTLFREGISALVRREPDMKVVASVRTGQEAIDYYRRSRPDVVLMDLQLPGMSGFEAIREIRRDDPEARI